jgi:hypothetical protein
LGEFSPFWRLFSMGSFLKITEVAKLLSRYFPRNKLLIKFDKNGLGYTLGDFFTNSSGRIALQSNLNECALLLISCLNLKMNWIMKQRNKFRSFYVNWFYNTGRAALNKTWEQGCRIFLVTKYQNGVKYTKWPQNIGIYGP